MARHLISNFPALATTKLRRDALSILEGGLNAVRTDAALRRTVRLRGDRLTVGELTYALKRYKNIYVIAIGKAGFDAAKELERILGDRITDGLVIDVKGGTLARMTSRVGTHPFPSLQNMKATGEIVALLKHTEKDDLVIVVVSGGGSALLCWPTELSCSEMTLMTKTLMKKGATIQEINTIRKHTSDIQGGQLAALAHPAQVIGLIFSDIPGDTLSMVASGPTFLDPTTREDAARLLQKYDLLKACRLPSCQLQETPKDPRKFQHVENTLVVSGAQALDAMKREAKQRGYRIRVYSTALTGEAQEVGKALASAVQPGEVLLAVGETTVTVRGRGGEGGRNQELALGALDFVSDDALVLSCASDGVDHSSAAGAIADLQTKKMAGRKRLVPARFLKAHDSFSFFEAVHAQILTGVTGMNVSDLMLAIREKA